MLAGLMFCIASLGAILESDRAWFGWWDDLIVDPAALESWFFATGLWTMGLGAFLGVSIDRAFAKHEAKAITDGTSAETP